jgi:putative NADH-flavin reductase
MKIALVGATGFVGSAVLAEAVSRGHEVTAIARHPEKVAALPGATAVRADVLNDADLAAKLHGHDVVIATYNPGWTNPNIRSEHLGGSQAITIATREAGVPRLLMVGGAGTSQTAPGVHIVDSEDFPAAYKEGALGAKEAAYWIEGETIVDWVFVLPAVLLVPGDRTGKYRTGGPGPVTNDKGESTISVADLAVALVDEAESPRQHRKRITVGY